MILDSEDTKTMKYIGINVLGLIVVTLLLITGALFIG